VPRWSEDPLERIDPGKKLPSRVINALPLIVVLSGIVSVAVTVITTGFAPHLN